MNVTAKNNAMWCPQFF